MIDKDQVRSWFFATEEQIPDDHIQGRGNGYYVAWTPNGENYLLQVTENGVSSIPFMRPDSLKVLKAKPMTAANALVIRTRLMAAMALDPKYSQLLTDEQRIDQILLTVYFEMLGLHGRVDEATGDIYKWELIEAPEDEEKLT